MESGMCLRANVHPGFHPGYEMRATCSPGETRDSVVAPAHIPGCTPATRMPSRGPMVVHDRRTGSIDHRVGTLRFAHPTKTVAIPEFGEELENDANLVCSGALRRPPTAIGRHV